MHDSDGIPIPESESIPESALFMLESEIFKMLESESESRHTRNRASLVRVSRCPPSRVLQNWADRPPGAGVRI